MFNVPRYDPAKQGKKSKGKKRKLPAHPPSPSSSTGADRNKKKSATPLRPKGMHVIAPDEEALEAKKLPKTTTTNEALDDLDLFIEEDIGEPRDSSNLTTTTTTTIADDDANRRKQNKNDGTKPVHASPEIQAALHVTTLPMNQVAQAWELAPFLCDNLRRDGFSSFFPIQALVIPEVITSERHPYLRAQDVCITAPTGSGKTLGYALPILNALSQRRIRRLRALVVLPGRDLARQVHSVFEDYVKGSNLRVGLAIGQSDFKAEQQALTIDTDNHDDPERVARQLLSFDPANLELARLANQNDNAWRDCTTDDNNIGNQVTSSTAIDILVCTPGRLVDHLDNTPGFTLQHLRFLVVDEADKLLSQSYQNWIDRVIEDANSASVKAWRDMQVSGDRVPQMRSGSDPTSYDIRPITWRRGGAAGDTSQFNTNTSYFHAAAAVCRPVQLRKFLVSATLTKDPQKLANLKLVNPKHFDVHQLMAKGRAASNKFSMAQGLSEYSIECKAEQKPIVLLALLLELLQDKDEKWTVVVFTSSVDSTHRLARLLQLLWIRGKFGDSHAVAEFSSALNQSERTALMGRCHDPNDSISVLVCSDGMSRGMDLERVHAVINYDVPSLAKTYVHRCGRTARAGKTGVAISILKGGQVVQFRRMRDLIQQPQAVQPWSVKKSLVQGVMSTYSECLQVLRKVIQEEDDGDISPTAPLELNIFDDGGDSDSDKS